MKSIYIIGGTSIESSRRLFDLPKDVNVVLVNSKEDIPLSDRESSDISCIFPFRRMPDVNPVYWEKSKKLSWKRDYKYHK